MGKIYDQMLLRQSHEYRLFAHAAILDVANDIIYEPEDTPAHNARVAMAEMIVKTNDQRVSGFIDRIVFRGIMDDAIRESLVRNGKVILDTANEDAILDGIAALWNETALAVWPEILDEYP